MYQVLTLRALELKDIFLFFQRSSTVNGKLRTRVAAHVTGSLVSDVLDLEAFEPKSKCFGSIEPTTDKEHLDFTTRTGLRIGKDFMI